MSKILYVMLGFVLSLSVVFTGSSQQVQAETIGAKDSRVIISKKDNIKVSTIKKEKLQSYGINKNTQQMLTVKVLNNFNQKVKKGNLKNVKTTKTITTSKDKRYVSIQYKLATKNKAHTWISYTVDTDENRILTKADMLKNEAKTTKEVTNKIAEKFNLASSQLKGKSPREVKPVQFYFNNKGELEFLYDSYHVTEKKNKSKILKVSNSKLKMNKTTYKVVVKNSLLK